MPAKGELVIDEETQLLGAFGGFPADTSEITIAVEAATAKAGSVSRSRARGDPLVDAPRMPYLPANVASMLCFAARSKQLDEFFRRRIQARMQARVARGGKRGGVTFCGVTFCPPTFCHILCATPIYSFQHLWAHPP